MIPVQNSILSRAMSTLVLASVTLGQILPIVPVANLNNFLGVEQIADAAISPSIKARFNECIRNSITSGGAGNKLDLSRKNFYNSLPSVQDVARARIEAWEAIISCSENSKLSASEAAQWISLFNNWSISVWQPKFAIAKQRYASSLAGYGEAKKFVIPFLNAYEYYINDTIKLSQDIFAQPAAKFTNAYDQRTKAFKSRFFHNSDAYQAYWAWGFAIALAQSIQNKDMRVISEMATGLEQVSPKIFDPNAPILQGVAAAYNLSEVGSPFSIPFPYTAPGGEDRLMRQAIEAHQGQFWKSKVKPRVALMANNSLYRLSKMGCSPTSCMKVRDLLADFFGIVGLPGEGIFPEYNASRLATRIPARTGSGVTGVLEDGARIAERRPRTNLTEEGGKKTGRSRSNNLSEEANKRPDLVCVAFNPDNEKVELSYAVDRTIVKAKTPLARILAESNAKVVSDFPMEANSEFANNEVSGRLELVASKGCFTGYKYGAETLDTIESVNGGVLGKNSLNSHLASGKIDVKTTTTCERN